MAKKKKAEARSIKELMNELVKESLNDPTLIQEGHEETFIPTRFPLLNHRLGGGIKVGAIMEIYGPENSAKSSLSAALAADIQSHHISKESDKNIVLVINWEGAYDYKWWRKLGLDTTEAKDVGNDFAAIRFIHLRPKSLELGVAKTLKLLETGRICAILMDSIYAAASKDNAGLMDAWEKEDGGGKGMAVEARAWGSAWNSLKYEIMKADSVCFAINQEREIIGGPPTKGFTKPTTSPRGKALRFFAWIRAKVRGKNLDDLPPDQDGLEITMRVIKNKTSEIPLGNVKFRLIRGLGFDLDDDLVRLGVECGAVVKAGAFYKVKTKKGEKSYQGKAKFTEALKSSNSLRKWLNKKVDHYLKTGEVTET